MRRARTICARACPAPSTTNVAATGSTSAEPLPNSSGSSGLWALLATIAADHHEDAEFLGVLDRGSACRLRCCHATSTRAGAPRLIVAAACDNVASWSVQATRRNGNAARTPALDRTQRYQSMLACSIRRIASTRSARRQCDRSVLPSSRSVGEDRRARCQSGGDGDDERIPSRRMRRPSASSSSAPQVRDAVRPAPRPERSYRAERVRRGRSTSPGTLSCPDERSRWLDVRRGSVHGSGHSPIGVRSTPRPQVVAHPTRTARLAAAGEQDSASSVRTRISAR